MLSNATEARRIVYLDVLRVIAIIMVLATHAVDRSGVPNLAFDSMRSYVDRMGVPLFFMISGSLLIPRAMQLTLRGFAVKYGKRIIHLVALTSLFSILTNAICFALQTDLPLWRCFYGAAYEYNFVLNGSYGYAWQLWYMPAIMGLYAVSPFLGRLLSCLSCKGAFALCAVLLLPLTGIPLFKNILSPYCHVYVAYFVMGWLLSSIPPRENKNENAILVVVVAALCLVTYTADAWAGHLLFTLHWYDCSIPLFISSCCLFRLIQNALSAVKGENRFIRSLSRCSFGIYLWHYAVLYVCVFLVPTGDAAGWGFIPYQLLYFLVPLGVSWLLTWAGSRIPCINRFLP